MLDVYAERLNAEKAVRAQTHLLQDTTSAVSAIAKEAEKGVASRRNRLKELRREVYDKAGPMDVDGEPKASGLIVRAAQTPGKAAGMAPGAVLSAEEMAKRVAAYRRKFNRDPEALIRFGEPGFVPVFALPYGAVYCPLGIQKNGRDVTAPIVDTREGRMLLRKAHAAAPELFQPYGVSNLLKKRRR